MTSAENIHPDMVIRARVKLLGVDRLPHQERTDAYRLLIRVDPRYLTHLVRSLLLWCDKGGPAPALRATLLTEAIAAAHRVPPTDPDRARLLRAALDAHEAQSSAADARTHLPTDG
ncbi:hypothetical protein [Streptacidiphilus jiangxiensis]|uniref:Uncharacterized protein n=1 Tax=Streptacidiphilus jiangxiensis TaxID=235985 RepID=A0A1H7F9L2_STRJI|nr:hypothetical protein [Streptacidiphilus jiangxiensis]SEK22027.1 hypothetical protein SAMN05414137_101130 [Streptacidiphilus jiangxiensis]